MKRVTVLLMMLVAARLINVETTLVAKAFDADESADSMQQLIELSENVAGGLSEDLNVGQTNNGYSRTQSSGRQVERFNVNGVTFEMVRVDGGSFMMGSYDGKSNEQPVHSETVGTFYIGKTEVTQNLWSAVMGSNPSSHRGENLPVEKVSWNDCQEFVERLSRLTGRIFRLPTEAEWEYAARGGNKSRGYTYSGSDDVSRVAWYTDNSDRTTHPVGMKSGNELGIFDMSGNVWEWCSDNYSDSYSQPRSNSGRVNRGGGWSSAATYCRVAYRLYAAPGFRLSVLGLRLALEDRNVGQTNNGYSRTQSRSGQVERFNVNGVTFEMVRVDGGSFMMGSYDGESNEQPIHLETVGTFYIGKTEVTQNLWSAVMGSNPSNFRGENLPVENVSWNDCQEFVARLSRLTGRIFRLPTEAEWEYAARGGNKSRDYTYSGSDDVTRTAWYHDNSDMTTHPVGMKSDNGLGIFDMSGNVWEWCSDNYSDSYSQPRSNSGRIARGGGWGSDATYCRVACRDYATPDDRSLTLGLRLAL